MVSVVLDATALGARNFSSLYQQPPGRIELFPLCGIVGHFLWSGSASLRATRVESKVALLAWKFQATWTFEAAKEKRQLEYIRVQSHI